MHYKYAAILTPLSTTERRHEILGDVIRTGTGRPQVEHCEEGFGSSRCGVDEAGGSGSAHRRKGEADRTREPLSVSTIVCL